MYLWGLSVPFDNTLIRGRYIQVLHELSPKFHPACCSENRHSSQSQCCNAWQCRQWEFVTWLHAIRRTESSSANSHSPHHNSLQYDECRVARYNCRYHFKGILQADNNTRKPFPSRVGVQNEYLLTPSFWKSHKGETVACCTCDYPFYHPYPWWLSLIWIHNQRHRHQNTKWWFLYSSDDGTKRYTDLALRINFHQTNRTVLASRWRNVIEHFNEKLDERFNVLAPFNCCWRNWRHPTKLICTFRIPTIQIIFLDSAIFLEIDKTLQRTTKTDT